MKKTDDLEGTYEVYDTNNQDRILALVYEETTNTLTQEGFSLWVQMQEDWLNVSRSGIIIRPAQTQCSSEAQFKEMATKWIDSSGASNAWVVKHLRKSPQLFTKGDDMLTMDELESIPGLMTEAGTVKMAVPAGRFLKARQKSQDDGENQ